MRILSFHDVFINVYVYVPRMNKLKKSKYFTQLYNRMRTIS